MGRGYEGNNVLERGDTGTNIRWQEEAHCYARKQNGSFFFLVAVEGENRARIVAGSWLGWDLLWPEAPCQCPTSAGHLPGLGQRLC